MVCPPLLTLKVKERGRVFTVCSNGGRGQVGSKLCPVSLLFFFFSCKIIQPQGLDEWRMHTASPPPYNSVNFLRPGCYYKAKSPHRPSRKHILRWFFCWNWETLPPRGCPLSHCQEGYVASFMEHVERFLQ